VDNHEGSYEQLLKTINLFKYLTSHNQTYLYISQTTVYNTHRPSLSYETIKEIYYIMAFVIIIII